MSGRITTSSKSEIATADTQSAQFLFALSTVSTAEVMNETMRTAYNTVTMPRPPNGNGRRIGVVPINGPTTGIVIGFTGMFLPPVPCAEVQIGNKTYEPCCGEYIGPVTDSGSPAAGTGGGAFRVVLFR